MSDYVLNTILVIALLGPLLVVLAYATSRAMSYAYFRTKLEHFRHMMHELRRGED